MTKEQKIEAYSMRLDGYTLQEIADKFGVTKERIRQCIPSEENTIRRPKKIYYPNLTNWMRKNRISSTCLADMLGVSNSTFSSMINGNQSTKMKTIVRVLEITGMTFEECFFHE